MEKDIKRLYACLEHKDYDAIREYIEIIFEKYNQEKRKVLLDIVSYVKEGNYRQIPLLLDCFRK